MGMYSEVVAVVIIYSGEGGNAHDPKMDSFTCSLSEFVEQCQLTDVNFSFTNKELQYGFVL